MQVFSNHHLTLLLRSLFVAVGFWAVPGIFLGAAAQSLPINFLFRPNAWVGYEHLGPATMHKGDVALPSPYLGLTFPLYTSVAIEREPFEARAHQIIGNFYGRYQQATFSDVNDSVHENGNLVRRVNSSYVASGGFIGVKAGLNSGIWVYGMRGSKKETGCCSLDSINDARTIAVQLGFPHFIIDIREEFGDFVINHFTDEYLAGRTPNPCVMCNTHIKWDALLRRADQLECEFIATGHYANIRHENGRYVISKGIDENKDQSYALWGISQQSLARTLFPLGNLHKSQIYDFAREKGFTELVNKSESYEICFIPDNDYRGFLKRRIHGLEEQVAGGEFVLEDGNVVGKHEGYPFYTIGQRKGLGVALGFPAYVTKIIKDENKVVLGNFDDLARNAMWVGKLNMGKYACVKDAPLQTITKVRYNDNGTDARILQTGNRMKVIFDRKVHAIAPGQAAVFYEGNDVVGGGWIEESFNDTQF